MDDPGTNRPKFFGILGGPGGGCVDSIEERSCSSSGLGRKKLKVLKAGCF
jgi:hypothetical protein